MLYQASWDRIKARLRSEVTADTYEKWIRRTAGYLGDGEFVISVPDGATRNFLESKLAITVLGLVREFALPVYEIRYKVSSNKTDLEYSEDAPVHPFDDDMNPVTDVKRWHKPKPRHLLLYTIDEHDAPLEDSHWKILGLQPGSTEEQIHKAYRKLSFSCHPDHVETMLSSPIYGTHTKGRWPKFATNVRLLTMPTTQFGGLGVR